MRNNSVSCPERHFMSKTLGQGRLGGSVVDCLPLAQVVILGSWDRHQIHHKEPVSPSAYVSASLSLSFMNKYIKSFLKKRKEIPLHTH